MPAWAWALLVMVVLIFAAWSYYKMLGKRPARMALAVLRALLLLVIVVVQFRLFSHAAMPWRTTLAPLTGWLHRLRGAA